MHASPTDAPVTPAAPCGAADPDRDSVRELAFRRSLRASRARRATAALRGRRTRRSRRSLLVAAAGLVALSSGALAQSGGSGVDSSATELSTPTIMAAQRALDVDADGIVGPQTRRATRRFQRSNGLGVDGVLGTQTLEALGVDVHERSARAAQPGTSATLERIAQCESGGDPTAVSADGLYRGKYQFDRGTWHSVGGRGDPVAAGEAEQDRRAATLLRRAGTSPWPNCA